MALPRGQSKCHVNDKVQRQEGEGKCQWSQDHQQLQLFSFPIIFKEKAKALAVPL